MSDIPTPTPAPYRSPIALACFLLTAAIGLAIDLWSKSVAWQTLALSDVFRNSAGRLDIRSETLTPIPSWLHLRLLVNEGAVFGMGQGNQVLFSIVSIAAIFFLSYLFLTSGPRHFYQFLLGILLAGVIGNLYDRLTFGYVRDMVYIFPERYLFGREVFPWIFNVADTLLCTGVGLMVLYSFVTPDPARKNRGAQTMPPEESPTA